MVKRILVRCYVLSRPVILPLAVRLHRRLSWLLNKEIERGGLAGTEHQVLVATNDALLQSMTAAELTLTLLCRERRR